MWDDIHHYYWSKAGKYSEMTIYPEIECCDIILKVTGSYQPSGIHFAHHQVRWFTLVCVTTIACYSVLFDVYICSRAPYGQYIRGQRTLPTLLCSKLVRNSVHLLQRTLKNPPNFNTSEWMRSVTILNKIMRNKEPIKHDFCEWNMCTVFVDWT